MFKFDWKKIAVPAALYAYGDYNEKKQKLRSESVKNLILLAKQKDFIKFEIAVLKIDYKLDLEKLWYIACKAADEVTAMSENISTSDDYIEILKKICNDSI
jgi:hypothetical protein